MLFLSSFIYPSPPTVWGMFNYVEKQYSGGAYKDYTKTRDLNIATFRGRMKHITEYNHTGRL